MLWKNDYTRSFAEHYDDPYVNFAHAIVVQAVTDTRVARDKKRQGELIALRKFFQSDWFTVLTRDRINGWEMWRRLMVEEPGTRTNITI